MLRPRPPYSLALSARMKSDATRFLRDGVLTVALEANALVRISREWDLERLHGVETGVAASRIARERGLGPWSAGMVCLYGLGRFEHGLVGDLGLVKLCSGLLGRRAEAEDTQALLAPYGEWAGLASVYLLAGGASLSRAA